jgi:hypothetical protein
MICTGAFRNIGRWVYCVMHASKTNIATCYSSDKTSTRLFPFGFSLIETLLFMHVIRKTVLLYALIAGIIVLSTVESTAVRDPTSIFFNPKKGYQPRYSQLRHKHATEFISAHNSTERFGWLKASNIEKKLCVGIPSFGYRGAQYVHEIIRSLLEGLAAEERDETFLMLFIPHIDPTNHPFYSEPWFHELTDRVLTYGIEDSDKDHVRVMEGEGSTKRIQKTSNLEMILTRIQ